MNEKNKITEKYLFEKYLPSESCSCEICTNFCKRPGWWTLQQAKKAIDSGYAKRMMLEISPDFQFAVLSPAFKGNEADFAQQEFKENGCTFLKNGLCELHDTDFLPIECSFCHHDRVGLGEKCHLEIAELWNTPEAKKLIVQWGNLFGFWEKQGFKLVEK